MFLRLRDRSGQICQSVPAIAPGYRHRYQLQAQSSDYKYRYRLGNLLEWRAMDVSHILDSLNDQQRNAVASPAPNLLVLAGAGSGKTRVLVHRVAWLIQAEQISPFGILAVTFTNKAAREMRGRIDELVGQSFGGMWVGTFHGLAHRLLRSHWQEAGLPEDFHILDSDDQLRLIKRINRSLNIDEERWPAKRKIAGVAFGWAAVLSSIMFAVGHMVGEAQTHRLGTFFPALIFAWLWRKSDSLWAPAIFHAGSNLLMQVLLASTFPPR